MRKRHLHTANIHVFVAVLAEIAAGAAAGASNWAGIAADVLRSVLLNSADIALLVMETAAPLVTSVDALTSVRALDAVMSSLRIFAAIDAASKIAEAEDAGTTSPLPSFLPQVHTTWPFFVSAVTSGHDVACRQAYEHISHTAKLSGGDFLRDRMRNDLWPHMRKALHPDAGLRTQVAVLQFIRSVAADERSRDAFRSIAMSIADAVSDLLSRDVSLARMGEADIAMQALESLSSLDGDGVFLLLCRLGRVKLPHPPVVRCDLARRPLFAALQA